MKTVRYVAFLRGINVGGKMVKMEKLREALEELGYENVKTLLNSGNVTFETTETTSYKLVRAIEQVIEKDFKLHSDVIIRTVDELEELVSDNPFKDIDVTPKTRLYITFLSERPDHSLKIPYVSPDKDYTILSVNNSEICSVLTLSENKGTVDAMSILEKEFGKHITTRNWNTVNRIVNAAS